VIVVARGAGTGLSGGALPHERGVLLSLARLNRIIAVDPDNCSARVQPGVRNLAISEAAKPHLGSTTPRTRLRRSPAPSAATSLRTPAACTASSTA
jgi:FAD/FMN-containing dehydrogenase